VFNGISGAANPVSHKIGFNGALSGNVITGTLSIETTQAGGVNMPGGSGSTSFPVTLQRP
jgi:hypothetical protein